MRFDYQLEIPKIQLAMKTIAFFTTDLTMACIILLATLVIPQKTAAQNNTNNQLITHEINTSKGKITVNLPAKIYAGDVISGTVNSKPVGNNEKKQQTNAKIIEGYVLDAEKNKSNVSEGYAKFQIPDGLLSDDFIVYLKDAAGKQLGKINIPVSGKAPYKFAEEAIGNIPPHIPAIIESGNPTSLTGSFDGDLITSNVQIGGIHSDVLAESPREIIFQSPENISGLQDISITEQDCTFRNQVRMVDLQLSASKTVLQKGEQTNIQMMVSGLENLATNVSLKIDNLTPAILNIEGGNHQEIDISPEQVNDRGVWEGTVKGRSILKGDFYVTVKVEPPVEPVILPVFPAGKIPFNPLPEFIWESVNVPENASFELIIREVLTEQAKTETKIIDKYISVQSPFTLPENAPPPEPGKNYMWQVQSTFPGGTVSSPEISWVFGPVEPEDIPPGPGDPCEDPKYVENEENECADIVRYVYEVPLNSVNEDFNTFKYDWQEYFRMLTQTMVQFDLQLSMIKYWIDAGDEIDKQAQDVQKLAGLIKKGIGHGATAFKKGGEEAMKEMARGFTEDKVKEFEQHAANQVSSTLGALYDLEDLAIRRIGLGIAKGLTGVYPDKMADHYRRQLQITTTELSAWVSHRVNYNSGARHPTLQEGIDDMCDMLNQLDQIEKDFKKAVEEAGFICIECEIPEHLLEMMEKLRQDIETHIRMFGDTIDQIRQRLVEARGIANNKKAYEDIARLGSFQNNSAKQTREINRVLEESTTEFQNALNTREQ